MRGWCASSLVILALAGCQKASDATNAKRMPQPPPPPATARIEPPDSLSIAITIDGQPARAIDAARLRAVPPDFADAERRAWKLSTLLGPAVAAPGTRFEVAGAPAAGLALTAPGTPSEPQPALLLNRRGEVIATAIAPGAPFPAYHGEGGRLHRPGDSEPHVGGVTRIDVRHAVK
jgi:hypothetical protein